jgi:hypothetical protein
MRFSVKYIGLILFGLLVGLIFAEIGLRFIPEDQLNEVIFHSARGRHLYTVDKNIGWVLKPNLNTEWETRDQLVFKVTTNSQGLRDEETSYQKKDGTYRILLLGDSFAEALQVNLADIFPTTLETCLRNRTGREIEVINAGTTAYGLGEEYLFYETRGIKYNPDLVLMAIFSGNDLADLDRHDDFIMIRIAGGYRFDLVNGGLEKKWLSWSQPEKPISGFEQFLRQNSLIYKVLRHPDSKVTLYLQEKFNNDSDAAQTPHLPSWEFFVHAQDFTHNPKTPETLINRWSVFEALIADLKRETAENGDKLAFVIIPNKQQAHHRFREQKILELAGTYSDLAEVAWDLEHEPNQTIVDFLTSQELPVLDLLPVFQAHDAQGKYDLYYEVDLHFNREGHYFTSELLCEWLTQTQLVPQ